MAVDTRYVHECTVFKTQEAPTPSKLVSLTLTVKINSKNFPQHHGQCFGHFHYQTGQQKVIF